MWGTLKRWIGKISKKVLIAGTVTLVFGTGKMMQIVGQALYASSLDDQVFGFSERVNKIMAYTAMAGSLIIALFSRIPKMYVNSKQLIEKQIIKTDATLLEKIRRLSGYRYIIYGISFGYFVFSGVFSTIFTTINAVQAGVVLMREFIGKAISSDLPPTAIEYFGATYVPLCNFYSYVTYNLMRILMNSRIAALKLANIGTGQETLTLREKISLVIAACFAIPYTIVNAAFALVSTESALKEINKLFFHWQIALIFFQVIGAISAIPSLASVLLTAGADLYKIFTGELKLFDVINLKKSTGRILLVVILLIAGVIDSVLSNGSGFFGSMLTLLGRFTPLSTDSRLVKAIAGSLSLLSIAPYFANSCAAAVQIVAPQKEKVVIAGEEKATLFVQTKSRRTSVASMEFWSPAAGKLTPRTHGKSNEAFGEGNVTSYGTLTPRTPRQTDQTFEKLMP